MIKIASKEFQIFNYVNEDETYLNDGLSSAFS